MPFMFICSMMMFLSLVFCVGGCTAFPWVCDVRRVCGCTGTVSVGIAGGLCAFVVGACGGVAGELCTGGGECTGEVGPIPIYFLLNDWSK